MLTRTRFFFAALAAGSVLLGAGHRSWAAPITDASYFNSVAHTHITFEQDGSGATLPVMSNITMPAGEYAAQGVTIQPNVRVVRDSDACFRLLQDIAGGSTPYGLSASNTTSMEFDPPVQAFGFVFVAIFFQNATFTAFDEDNNVIETAVFTGPFIDGSGCGFLEHGFVGIESTTPIHRVTVSAPSGAIDNLRFAPAETDADDDGIADEDDNCPDDANPGQEDADGDGLGDACDACPFDAANDSDGDGVCGNVDNCPTLPNAGQDDADSDGIGDICDVCSNDASNDGDGDGVCEDLDNCPGFANPGQEDSDGDLLGDACDLCPLDANNDADGDGVCGDEDNCPNVANTGQENADGDAQGDACDACPNDPANDLDGDGLCGDVDNCPSTANADQADLDGDGIGDACDGDIDGDGLSNANETVFGTNPLVADTDGDGLSDGVEVDTAMGSGCPNPTQADSDGDSLPDGYELLTLHTSPCSADTDGDGVADNVDPLPLEPGVTQGYLQSLTCQLAIDILQMDHNLFTGNNAIAKKARRATLALHAALASALISHGNYNAAQNQLENLLDRIDGVNAPQDWMVPSAQKTALAEYVDLLISLIDFF